MPKAYIKEIFESIQGEALYIGQKQIFIRFCGCNLSCNYCDTDFKKEDKIQIYGKNINIDNPISAVDLKNIVESFDADTISLTGGEPLLAYKFLLEFLPLIKNKKIYLETNGTLPNELAKIINFVDIVSMDIKLPSATKQKNYFIENEKFIDIATRNNKEIFAKIVLDKNYAEEELLKVIELLKKNNITLIIQPMDCKDKSQELDKNSLLKLFDFTYKKYPNVRIIAQMHKFLNLQ